MFTNNFLDLSDNVLDDGLSRTENDNEDEYPNELCLSLSSSSPRNSTYFNSLQAGYPDPLNQSDVSDQNRLLECWKMNYHESAIYLQVFHLKHSNKLI